MRYLVILFASTAFAANQSTSTENIQKILKGPKPGQCQDDYGCSVLESCIDGYCVPGQRCHSDGECGPFSKCVGGTCH